MIKLHKAAAWLMGGMILVNISLTSWLFFTRPQPFRVGYVHEGVLQQLMLSRARQLLQSATSMDMEKLRLLDDELKALRAQLQDTKLAKAKREAIQKQVSHKEQQMKKEVGQLLQRRQAILQAELGRQGEELWSRCQSMGPGLLDAAGAKLLMLQGAQSPLWMVRPSHLVVDLSASILGIPEEEYKAILEQQAEAAKQTRQRAVKKSSGSQKSQTAGEEGDKV